MTIGAAFLGTYNIVQAAFNIVFHINIFLQRLDMPGTFLSIDRQVH